MQRTCTNELTSLLFHILPLPRSNNNYARMILYNYLNILRTSSRWRLCYDLLFMMLNTHVAHSFLLRYITAYVCNRYARLTILKIIYILLRRAYTLHKITFKQFLMICFFNDLLFLTLFS